MKCIPSLIRSIPVFLCLGLTIPIPAGGVPPVATNVIRGTVRFTNLDPAILQRLGPPGNEGVSSLSLFAQSGPPEYLSATRFLPQADPLSNEYALAVSVSDVPTVYRVFGALSLDGSLEEYRTAPAAAAPLTISSPPADVHLEECVGLIELRYVRADGTPVEALDGRATVSEAGTPDRALRARYFHQPAGRTGNFLAVPSGVDLSLEVEADVGTDIYLDRLTRREVRMVTVACDEILVVDLIIPEQGALGRITGNFNLAGELEWATEGYLELLGRPVVRAFGPSGNQRYAALDAELPGPDSVRGFSLPGLVPSEPGAEWRLQAELQFREGHRFEYFVTPMVGGRENSPGLEVRAGKETSLEDLLVMTPSVLAGRITLTGPFEFAGTVSALRSVVRASDFDADLDGVPDGIGASGINGSYVVASGLDVLAPGATRTAAGGSAAASFAGSFNEATAAFEGDYEIVVAMPGDDAGAWSQDGMVIALSRPASPGVSPVEQSIYVTEANPWSGTLAPGERRTNDLRYGFAEVCVRIQSPTPFHSPRVVNGLGLQADVDSTGQLRFYQTAIARATAPPYAADAAVYDATVTMYLPEGSYVLQPAITLLDGGAAGGSEVVLPPIDLSVIAGETFCVEDCLRLVFTGPACTTNFGFLTWVDATSCEATLTNLSLTSRPLSDPSIRLGYSDIRILEPAGLPRATLRTGHGLFPEFDGYDRSLYSNIVYTAEARDTKGRVVTRRILAHYDLAPPTMLCPGDLVVSSPDGGPVPVEFSASAVDNRPEPLLRFVVSHPSGSLFPLGTTRVTAEAVDLCRNTNTCTFNVTVLPPGADCVVTISPRIDGASAITVSWECGGILQSADAVDGPWNAVAGATSPFTTLAPAAQRFFRVCVSGDCGSR